MLGIDNYDWNTVFCIIVSMYLAFLPANAMLFSNVDFTIIYLKLWSFLYLLQQCIFGHFSKTNHNKNDYIHLKKRKDESLFLSFMYEMYICTSWALYINLDIWDYKFFEMFLKDMRTKTWQVLEIKQNKIMYTLLTLQN